MTLTAPTVIHSCTSSSFSGLEGYALELATWQNGHGKSVVFFCREGTPLEEAARSRGLPVWTIGEGEHPGPRLWLKMAREWKRRLRASPVTLHMHAGGEPWYHLPWLGRPRRTILHYHIWINHRKIDPAHWLLFRGIDEVWTSSETARAHLAALLPVRREAIRVVPYGRDVRGLLEAPRETWRSETRERLAINDDEVLGVCVSRIERIKGIGELFDAFAQVAARYPKAHLALVGDASPDNEEASRFAASLRERHRKLPESIRNRFHIMGYVTPATPVLAAADFYVLPSYEECMSLAMLDAAILGLPIIGTSSGGTPSVARPGETGLLVPPGDAGRLATALGELYGDPDKIRRLSEGARALGGAFDQESIFREIWRWYEAPSATKMFPT
jgi:glycosyltransferase involved in cell wall biosynthesis